MTVDNKFKASYALTKRGIFARHNNARKTDLSTLIVPNSFVYVSHESNRFQCHWVVFFEDTAYMIPTYNIDDYSLLYLGKDRKMAELLFKLPNGMGPVCD